MKRIALMTVLLVALLVPASAATALAAGTTAATTPAKSAKAAKADTQSAAERRAASSDFERQKLDQGAFASADAKATKRKDAGGSGSMLRALFGLVVVLGAIYGVHWLLKKWGSSRMQGVAGRSGVIDVVATTPLAQGRALHLVRVGNELVLVGATEQSITRIGEVDASVLGAQMGNAGQGEFQAMLAGAVYGQQPGVPNTGATRDPFLRRFIDNLRLSTAR